MTFKPPVFKFGNCLGFGWSAANFVLGFRVCQCPQPFVGHMDCKKYGALSIQLPESLRFAATIRFSVLGLFCP